MAVVYARCLQMGQASRGELSRITGTPDRSARDLLSEMFRLGFLRSPTPKGVVHADFPAPALGYLLPNLYPQAALPDLTRVSLSQLSGG